MNARCSPGVTSTRGRNSTMWAIIDGGFRLRRARVRCGRLAVDPVRVDRRGARRVRGPWGDRDRA
jgi:hypothetical protein